MRTSLICRTMFAFAITLGAAAVLFSNISCAIVSLVFILTYVYAYRRFEHELRTSKLETRRTTQEEMVHAKEPFWVKLQILNIGPVTVRGTFEDRLPLDCTIATGRNTIDLVLPPSSSVSLSYSLLPQKRGTHSFRGLVVRRVDNLGLLSEEETIEAPFSITAHTRRESFDAARKIIGREHLEMSGAARRPSIVLRELEFDGVREYVAGDRARDILWKAYPKFDKLLTKTYKKEGALQTTILVDCSSSMRLHRQESSKIDHAVDLSMQLSNLLLSGLHPAGIMTFDEVKVLDKVSPALGQHQFQKILRILRSVPSSFKGREESGTTGQPAKQNKANSNSASAIAPSPDNDEFFAALSSLRKKEGRIDLGMGLEGAIKGIISLAKGQEQLFIVISDMLSSRDSVLTGAKICRRTGNRIMVIQTYDDWYNATDRILDPEAIDGQYVTLSDSLKIEGMLRTLGASYIRIGPADSAAGIARAIRRGRV